MTVRGEPRARQDLAGIQILRAAAAFAVVVHHTLEMARAGRSGAPDWLVTSTAAGVDVFFVISGFIMLVVSFPQNKPPIAPKPFLIRRVVRIYPLYWLCLVVLLAFMAAGFLQNQKISPLILINSIILAPSKLQIVHVAWTLVYELYFYLIFAVFLLFRSPLISVIGTTVVIALVISLAGVLPTGTYQRFFADTVALEFCFGLFIAFMWRQRGGWRMVLPVAMVAVVVIAIMPLFDPTHPSAGLDQIPRAVGWGIPAAILVAAVVGLKSANGWVLRSLVAIGDSSYALYLTHIFGMIVYGFALKHSAALRELPQWPFVAVVCVGCVIVGLLTHYRVEAPLNRFIRRWIDGVISRKVATPDSTYPSAGGI